MTPDTIVHIERHQMLRDAHAVIVQSLKYPDTVNREAVKQAHERIRSFQLLSAFAETPPQPEGASA